MIERNQIIHGDCLDVMRQLPAASVDAIITDPPYGISYQSAWRIDIAARKAKIANDGQPFIWWLYDAARVLKPGGALICFCEWRHAEVWRTAIAVAGLTLKSQIVWDRQWHGMGDLHAAFAPQHDLAWFATKGRFTFPGKRPVSVIRAQRIAADKLVHPTEKPVELLRTLISSVSRPGALVLDCFAGSGSTLVAAKAEGRHYLGIEREAEYVAIIEARVRHARDNAPAKRRLATAQLPLLLEVSA